MEWWKNGILSMKKKLMITGSIFLALILVAAGTGVI